MNTNKKILLVFLILTLAFAQNKNNFQTEIKTTKLNGFVEIDLKTYASSDMK